MRDDTHRWAHSDLPRSYSVDSGEVSLHLMKPTRLTLMSGDFTAAMKLSGLSIAHGWPDRINDNYHALRLRRDRTLIVGGPPLKPSWNEEAQLAISEVTSAFGVIRIQGELALSLLQSGTEIYRERPSASVLRLWHSIHCMVVAADTDEFHLYVPRSYLRYAWEELTAQAELMRICMTDTVNRVGRETAPTGGT